MHTQVNRPSHIVGRSIVAFAAVATLASGIGPVASAAAPTPPPSSAVPGPPVPKGKPILEFAPGEAGTKSAKLADLPAAQCKTMIAAQAAPSNGGGTCSHEVTATIRLENQKAPVSARAAQPEQAPQATQAPQASPTGLSGLNPGQTLWPDQSLDSRYGPYSYSFVMQSDGQIVLYSDGRLVSWYSGTGGHPGTRLIQQTDGNLVAYDAGGRAIWDTHTWGHPGAYFRMQADGNAVVYSATGQALWWTGTYRRNPVPVHIEVQFTAWFQSVFTYKLFSVKQVSSDWYNGVASGNNWVDSPCFNGDWPSLWFCAQGDHGSFNQYGVTNDWTNQWFGRDITVCTPLGVICSTKHERQIEYLRAWISPNGSIGIWPPS